MKLPELSESASPEFTDAETCKRWLEHVPLANVGAAQRELATQLGELNRFPTAAAQRLAVMEALREAVSFVQIEQARRFSNRALPMSDAETAAFTATIALWDEMRAGYERCLDAALNRDAGMRAQAALICQRLLSYIGLRMFHYYRAYRQVPPGDWRSLHATYAAAEKLDVAEDTIKDFLNRDIQDTSPRIAYVRAVLTGMCSPNELAQRQLTFVAYLLERWASKLEVLAKPVDEGEGVPPLVADLESDVCPERGATQGVREPRYLDARKLAKSLRNRVALAFGALFVTIAVLCLLAPVYAHDVAHTGPNDNHITETVSVGSKPVDVVSPTGVPIGPTWKGRFLLGADSNGRVGVKMQWDY